MRQPHHLDRRRGNLVAQAIAIHAIRDVVGRLLSEVNRDFNELVSEAEGVGEVRVTEIPPGATLPPLLLAVDEVVYVLQGRGLTSVWPDGESAKRTFEWGTRSLFLVPKNIWHQYSNTQGDRPVRLMHYNYLPIAMSAAPIPEMFFNTPVKAAKPDLPQDLYAAHKPDVVSICTWPRLHRPMTLETVKAGVRGIVCEKPLALDGSEVREMLAACRKADAKLAVAHPRAHEALPAA